MENTPEKKFKAGAVSATIWANKAETGSFFTVSLERNYKDKEGSWKSSKTLRANDLPKAELVLRKAYEYMIMNDSTRSVS